MNTYADSSCFCSKSELELFATPPVNIAMERGAYVTHRTIASITDTSPLEFHIPGSAEEYVDLGRTTLRLKIKLTKTDGNNPAADAKLSLANLTLHSLFSQVDCKLNQKLVTPSVNTYPYKAYLETILSHGTESKNTWLASELYYDDRGDVSGFDPTADNANTGLVSRRDRIKEGRVVELVGRPHVDIFQQDKYLLNGVDLDIKFTRSNPAFHLMTQDTTTFKLHILDATLDVRKVKINPVISLEHNKTHQQGITAKYPVRRGVVSTFTIPQGNQSYNKENLLQGQLPRRLVLGFVENQAFNGHPKKNPFNFQHFDLNFLAVNTDTQQFPSQPLKPNFEQKETVREFYNLYAAMELNNSRAGLITLQQFTNGFTLFPIDLTPDQAEGAHIDPVKYGNLRLEAHFTQALQTPVNCICYAEYDNMIQIDHARNVISDFAPS